MIPARNCYSLDLLVSSITKSTRNNLINDLLYSISIENPLLIILCQLDSTFLIFHSLPVDLSLKIQCVSIFLWYSVAEMT